MYISKSSARNTKLLGVAYRSVGRNIDFITLILHYIIHIFRRVALGSRRLDVATTLRFYFCRSSMKVWFVDSVRSVVLLFVVVMNE